MPIGKAHLYVDDSSKNVSQDTVTNNTGDRAAQFWQTYSKEADECDDDFLQKNGDNIEGVMLFAGLFSAVSATFLVAMQSNLQPDPTDTTNALLMMLVHANNNSAFADQDLTLPVWNGPSSTVVCSQALGYAALSASLLAALGAVLGKQWLTDYTQLRSGPVQERCRRRQQKLDSLKAWRFEVVISALPALIQLALLLFSIALAITLWEVNRVVGAVLITSTAIGVFLYLFMTLASLFFPTCPFQTPVSSSIHGVVGGVMKSVEEGAEYWAWRTDKHNQPKRPMISRGGKLMAYTGGVVFYPLLVVAFSVRLVLLAVLGPLIVLIAWVRKGRGALFQARLYSYRSAFHFRTLKSRLHSSTLWVRDSARNARNYIRRAYLDPEPDSGTSDPHAIAWILETSIDPNSLMIAAERVPDVAWPESLDISLPTEHLYSIFIRSLSEKSGSRALRLGRAFIIMLCQMSKEVTTHVWEEALRRVTEESMILDPDSDSNLLFILTVITKLLCLKLGYSDQGVELSATSEVSQQLLSWFLQPLEVLLVLEHPHQSRFLPEAYRAFLKLKWPEESKLEASQGLQYLRTFEIYFNSVVGVQVERTEGPVKQNPQEMHADFLKRILQKLMRIDLSQLPGVHQFLIVPLTVLSRLASVSYMQQAFKDSGINPWMIKAFKETVGETDGGGGSILLFASCIMKLATVIDAFNPTGTQVENPVTDGDARGLTLTPSVRMDSRSLMSFLLTKEIPASSEQVVYALQIILANVDELPELASNLEFVNYIMYATGPGQVYSILDVGTKVLVAACKHLILARDAPKLAILATQCDLVRFLRRGILKEDPPTILENLLHNHDENFNADLYKILAPALGDPFNTLLIKLGDEPNKIPEADLRDLEIALVLSNMEDRKRLLYNHLDLCIAQMPHRDYRYTMALPLAVIVGWLLRRDGPLSNAPDERVWKSLLRPSFEELLFPAWGDADSLEENPQMLRLLLDCSTRWLSTFTKSRKDSGTPSGSRPSPSTLVRLDGALDQLRSASQRLSSDIKRALQKLSREIKQYLQEEV